jgi:hypothetical protein
MSDTMIDSTTLSSQAMVFYTFLVLKKFHFVATSNSSPAIVINDNVPCAAFPLFVFKYCLFHSSAESLHCSPDLISWKTKDFISKSLGFIEAIESSNVWTMSRDNKAASL